MWEAATWGREGLLEARRWLGALFLAQRPPKDAETSSGPSISFSRSFPIVPDCPPIGDSERFVLFLFCFAYPPRITAGGAASRAPSRHSWGLPGMQNGRRSRGRNAEWRRWGELPYSALPWRQGRNTQSTTPLQHTSWGNSH